MDSYNRPGSVVGCAYPPEVVDVTESISVTRQSDGFYRSAVRLAKNITILITADTVITESKMFYGSFVVIDAKADTDPPVIQDRIVVYFSVFS